MKDDIVLLNEDDIVLLNEDDIPGASLNGKDPSKLTVVQLRRWLVCRGAPVSGKSQNLFKGIPPIDSNWS